MHHYPHKPWTSSDQLQSDLFYISKMKTVSSCFLLLILFLLQFFHATIGSSNVDMHNVENTKGDGFVVHHGNMVKLKGGLGFSFFHRRAGILPSAPSDRHNTMLHAITTDRDPTPWAPLLSSSSPACIACYSWSWKFYVKLAANSCYSYS